MRVILNGIAMAPIERQQASSRDIPQSSRRIRSNDVSISDRQAAQICAPQDVCRNSLTPILSTRSPPFRRSKPPSRDRQTVPVVMTKQNAPLKSLAPIPPVLATLVGDDHLPTSARQPVTVDSQQQDLPSQSLVPIPPDSAAFKRSDLLTAFVSAAPVNTPDEGAHLNCLTSISRGVSPPPPRNLSPKLTDVFRPYASI